MQALGLLKCSVRLRWVDEGLSEALLILGRQAQQTVFLDDALGGVMGGADDKIRQAAPPELRCALQGRLDAGWKPCLQA